MGLRRGQAGLGTLGTDQLEEAQVAARSPLLMCSLRDSVPESDGCCRLPSPIPVADCPAAEGSARLYHNAA